MKNLTPPTNALSMASPFHPDQTCPPGTTTGTGTCPVPPPLSLSRYDSAPGSFLSTLASSSDHHPSATSAAGPSHGGALFGRFFPGESSSSSLSMTSDSVGPADQRQQQFASGSGHHEVANHDPNPLVRHSSSPAGFFSTLLLDNCELLSYLLFSLLSISVHLFLLLFSVLVRSMFSLGEPGACIILERASN